MSNKKIAALAAGLCGCLCWAGISAATGVGEDFDGDGRSDIGVYDPASGDWSIQRSSDNGLFKLNWGSSEMRPVLGDFDGDGVSDLAVFNKQSSNWFIRNSSSGSSSVNFGLHQGRVVPGDYDGDGKTDLAVYQRSTGNWMIRKSSNFSVEIIQFGFSETRPVQADYDGDGKTDIAVYHRATANWYIRNSSDGQIQVFQWGWSQARPVVGDYDDDGKADIAVYHLATGNWYIRQSHNGQLRQQNWGYIETRPVPDDYDGDGETDIAVYRRKTGDWFILQSSTDSLRLQNWGWSNVGALPSYRNGGIQNLIILAMGDSITYGDGSQLHPKTGYPPRLERICEPSLGGHCVVINEGNSGEQTKDGKNRLPGLLVQHKPDLTLIMEGTNDEFFNVPYSTTESNLRKMVASAQSAGSAVIISTIPPVIKNSYRDRSAQEQRIEGFNPRVFKIASSMGIVAVDNWSAITSKPNWQNTLMDQPTANHPNDAGYVVMRDAWFSAIHKGVLSGLYY